MRLLTVACLSLVLVGFASGCATMRNPLASKTDPQEASRRRMIAEMNARTEKGDIAGAREILARLEASEQAGQADSSVIPLGQPRTSDPAEVDKLVDRLVALDPPALRESNRQKYAQFSPSTLKQMLAEYERTASFGQPNLNQFVPAANNSELLYASNSQPQDTARQTAPGNSIAGQRSAPDPRLAGGQSLGTQSPWADEQRLAQSASGQAPRLPDAGLADATRNIPSTTGGGLQTVSGEMPAGNGIAGASSSPVNSNPFPDAGQPNAQRTNDLPLISPGNTGFLNSTTRQDPITRMSGSLPPAGDGANRFPDPGAASNGGVSLLNQISPLDENVTPSSALNSGFDTGAFPGSTQSGMQEPPGLQFPAGSNPQTPRLGDSVSSQSGLPGVLETGVQGVQQIIPRIKDAAGRTLRNFGQAESSGNPASLAMNSGQGDISSMILALKTELLTATPGQTDAERVEYIRKHVNLRMLNLVNGDVGQAVEPIPGISSADQEFWQQMIWSVSNYFDDQGMPDPSVRSAETIEQLRGAIAQLGQTADLKLRNTTFCHRIVSFGNYERFKEDRFTTGQPVLLYSEVENFTSRRSSNDGYRTILQSAIEIYRASDLQQPAATIPLASDTTEDFCRAQRRDYFHSYEFSIPPNLEPGQYTLVLRVVDQQSRKVATSKVNFEVE
ncbi:MAG: hypothetical protein O2945_07045 [Planctomycetota bacterium]|nr:hypothetical protein [Planctomycetota bacterium]MDA0918808.1 hypothetical protein [Planctomycetota bacterium]